MQDFHFLYCSSVWISDLPVPAGFRKNIMEMFTSGHSDRQTRACHMSQFEWFLMVNESTLIDSILSVT